MWFAGVHVDIGGGYLEKQSGLSKYPLLWMIDEATKCGLQVNQATSGPPGAVGARAARLSYVVPDVRGGELHTSLKGAWWILEYLPKSAGYKEWPARETYFGPCVPDAEPRLIPDGAIIHKSARAARGRDLQLPAGEFAEATFEKFPDAEAASGMQAQRRRKKRSFVGWAKRSVPTIRVPSLTLPGGEAGSHGA